jgi:putative DNA primase/helicase
MSFDADQARAMLAHLSPDMAREEWLRVAFALKAELPDAEAFELFDGWSRDGQGYREADTRSTWRSIKAGGGVKGGTLVAMAQAAGWKRADKPRRPTPAERRAEAVKRREAAEREARETEAQHRAAAQEAAELWARGQEGRPAPYLDRKGIGAHGTRTLADGTLLVPLRDAAGELWSVQTIKPARPAEGGPPGKLFTKGARKSGLWHLIGTPPAPGAWLMLAEGYATAASVHEATGRPVAVAFDVGNLRHVAQALRVAFPDARLAVAGDDDRPTAQRSGKNPGREAAEAVAREHGGAALLPTFAAEDPAGTDFNDLHAAQGLEAVREQIEAGLRAFEAAELANTGTASDTETESAADTETAPDADIEGTASPAPDEEGTAAPQAQAPQRSGKGGRQRPARATKPAEGGGDAPPEAFKADDSGVWRYLPPGRDGDGGGWRRVCDPLHVEALARDQADGSASLVLSFRSMFKADRRLILPLSALAGDGGAWRGTLADAGFAMPADTHRRRWLGEYLAGARPELHARLTERTGWHGRAFVLPAETIGGDEAAPVLFAGEKPEGGLSVRGDLVKWRWLIGRHCTGQTRPQFAVSVALSGPCLAWAGGIDSGGFHLVGDSSGGKTTTLRTAASVWGPPGFVQRWRGTDNGIEALAAAHSDLCLMLDELAQLDPRTAGEAAYMLGNSAGKVRSQRSGSGTRPRLTWRLLFLSSGEVGLSDHMAEAGKKPKAGQELRLVDLPADAGRGYGAFDHPGEFGDPGALARHLNDAAGKVHGALGRAWLEHLTANVETLAHDLRQRIEAFEARAVPETASGQVQRVARRFALVAAAGELATAAGLTGWSEGEAQAATLCMFNAWLEARPAGTGNSETVAMLRQVRGWFEAHGEARFTDWDRAEDNHRPQTMNRAGWRKSIETERGMAEVEAVEWLVLPEVFRTEIAKGWSDRALLRLLADRDHLKRQKGNEYTSRVRVPGLGMTSVIRIRSTLLDEGEA